MPECLVTPKLEHTCDLFHMCFFSFEPPWVHLYSLASFFFDLTWWLAENGILGLYIVLWLQMIRELSTVKVKELFIQRFNKPLKNASYPTSIVFKGLRKSKVGEELSIKD